jgi:hypothetical protein
MRSLRILSALGLIAGLAVPAGQAGAQSSVDKTDNVRQVARFEREGGTELAAAGRFVYSGQLNGGPEYPSRNTAAERGGMHVHLVRRNRVRHVGSLNCPGNDNTVRVVRRGLVAMAHHVNDCNPPEASGESAHGMMLVNVRNPRRPRLVGTVNLPSGGSAHTLTPYPGKNLVYISPGGLPTNGGGRTHIVDVSRPRNPKIVADFVPPSPPTGCHDFAFHISRDKKLGFCAGYGATQIWDVSDPLEPQVLSRIVNPAIQFHHFAIASSDGNLLAIDDEAFAFHECHTGQSPTGRVWIYDISDPSSPVLQSSFAPPRGGDGTVGHFIGWIPSWCLSHGLDWMPGTHNLAVTWFSGGWSVLDLSEPTSPEEVAFFMDEDSAAYSALWHRGLLFINDTARGVEAFSIRGLRR